MSEPNPPSQPKVNGSGESAGSSPVQFNSATSTKASQPKDYFAEQNKKRAEKKQKASKARKKIFIIGGVIALVAIIVAVIFIVIDMQTPKPTVKDDTDGDGNTDLSGAQNLSEQVTDVFEPTYEVGENGNIVVDGDLEAAEVTFVAALANPANKDRIDTIYLAQIIFYSSLSNNQRIVEIAENVNPSKLNLSERIKFYNLTYLAYAALGNKDRADHYYKLTREAADKVTGIGG